MADSPTNHQEYVSVSLNERETINGKTLMITAYSAIFVLLFLYVASIFFREKKVLKKTSHLKKQLENKWLAEK